MFSAGLGHNMSKNAVKTSESGLGNRAREGGGMTHVWRGIPHNEKQHKRAITIVLKVTKYEGLRFIL